MKTSLQNKTFTEHVKPSLAFGILCYSFLMTEFIHSALCAQYYPIEEVLSGKFIMDQFRPDLIQMVLQRLRPDNVRSVRLPFCKAAVIFLTVGSTFSVLSVSIISL